LIERVQAQLEQRVSSTEIFTIRWTLEGGAVIARVEAVPNCPSIRRAMREHSMSGRVGISGKLPEICCQHKKPGLIGLDFSTDATDDLFNTSAATTPGNGPVPLQ